MKTKNIIKYLHRAFDLDDSKAKEKALDKALKKLRKREDKFKRRLDEAASKKDVEAIESKIKVIRQQRRKGLAALRALAAQ